MAELKKCPFCGGEVHIVPEQIDARTVSYQFICEECCCNTYFDYADREEAIEAWNNRATEAKLRANVIDEFAEKLKREEVYVDVTSDDMVYVKYCRYIDEIAEQMKGEKEQREFNQKECDWRYKASCIADANCADECDMDCPYKKNEKTLVKGEKE